MKAMSSRSSRRPDKRSLELLSSSTKETSGRVVRNSRIARATSGWNGAEVVKPTAMRPARQAMARGHGSRHVLLQQGVDREAFAVGQAGADEGDVQAFLAQARQKVGRAAFLQHEGDVGPRRPELADGARHQRMEWCRGGEAHGDAAGLAARRAAGPGRGAIDRGQHRLGIGQEGAPGIGQPDAARMAHEQGRVDLLFQRLDLLRQRRLLHVQLLRRARDVALTGDGDEVAEMAEFHLDIYII